MNITFKSGYFTLQFVSWQRSIGPKNTCEDLLKEGEGEVQEQTHGDRHTPDTTGQVNIWTVDEWEVRWRVEVKIKYQRCH